ncbi:MAG: hypothetical protein JNM43_21955 [Planctomycetaceae bacterium]|nr:hypothetical protein [Planctomycetaceae bacterium]
MNSESDTVTSTPTPATPRWRRATVTASMIVGMLLTGTAVAPSLLLRSYRNEVLASAVKDPSLQVSCQDLQGGWFTPLSFSDVSVQDVDGKLKCSIATLQTSRTLFSFLTSARAATDIVLKQPQLEVHVAEDGKWPVLGAGQPDHSEVTFAISDGSFRMTVPWRSLPIVDLKGLDLKGAVRPGSDGRQTLTTEGTRILDHVALSDLHADQNLALIAPVLSQSTEISGSTSLWLEPMSVPLEGDAAMNPFPIRGRAVVHSLQARLKQDWARQLALVAGQMSGSELPDEIQVAQDSEIRFDVSEQGIRHDSMVFLLPEIAESFAVESSGAILLDESLDLTLTVQLPKVQTADKPFLSMLAQMSAEPLRLAVKGTVSKPQLQMPEGMDVLGQLMKRISPASYQEEAPSIPEAAGGLIEKVGQPGAKPSATDLTGGIIDLIRAIDKTPKDPEAAKAAREAREKKKAERRRRKSE